MIRYYLYATILLLGLGAVGGWSLNNKLAPDCCSSTGHPGVVTKKETVYIDRVITKTRIVYPDGRIEEKETTEEKTETVSSSKTKNTKKQDYSLGLSYRVGVDQDNLDYKKNVIVTGGRRMLGDIWLELQIQPMDKALAAGVSYKW